jgi:very-short-patch-repair endonuclease
MTPQEKKREVVLTTLRYRDQPIKLANAIADFVIEQERLWIEKTGGLYNSNYWKAVKQATI